MSTAQVPNRLARWSGGGVAVIVDQHAAVARLPGQPHQDPYERLAAAFLVGYGTNTARSYATDLRAWWVWCQNCEVHPFDARRHHADAWVRSMETSTEGSPLKPASIRRRLSAVSNLYKYGIDAEALTYSPIEHVKRPKAGDEPESISLSTSEVRAMLAAASDRSPLHLALITLLTYNGLRIDEALGASVSDYTHSGGHRILRIRRKGGNRATTPLAPPTVRALEGYLVTRPTSTGSDPLFASGRGERLPYPTAFSMIKSVARAAALPAAAQVTPHTMRHTFITEALAAGAPLQDVQDAAGHKDPQTTRRYDRNRLSNNQHPTHAFAIRLARSDPAGDVP